MSNQQGTVRRHKFHGDPARFEEVADFVADHFGHRVHHIADVAGGQGMLSRFLNKRGYAAEVIDPRGWTLTGIASRPEEYLAGMADYYDLIIGLHPDEALRPVVESAGVRPVLVIPCCNFWDRDRKLGRDALHQQVSEYFRDHKVPFERVEFSFASPNNMGFVTGSR
jgi:hypothetical protein